MSNKRKWLLAVSIVLSLYLVGSIPYYLSETSLLDRFPVIAAIYLLLIAIHGGIILLALLFQWLGFGLKKPGLNRLTNLMMILSIFPFFPSIVVLLPLSIINAIVRRE